MHYKALCARLCEHYAKVRQRKKMSLGKGKTPVISSETDSDCVVRGVGGVNCVKEGAVVGKGEGVGGERENRTTERNDKRGREERETGGGREDRSGEPPRTGGGGGGDKKRPHQRKQEVGSSDSDVESSSCDGEDSPRVDTDDVSLSDTSLFEGDASCLKRERPTFNRYSSVHQSTPSASSAREPGGEDRKKSVSLSPSSGRKTEKDAKKKKKKKKKPLGHSAQRILSSASDFESLPQKDSPRARVTSSSSSSSSSTSSAKVSGKTDEGSRREKKAKKSFLNALTSGSEEDEGSPQEEKVKRTSGEAGSESDADHTPALSPSPGGLGGPIVYATPRKLDVSSDSDDDMDVLERKRKKPQLIGSDSSSGGEGGRGKETVSGRDSKMKQQKGKRRKRVDSSDGDFESREVSIRGPKLKRRRVARALLSDSDSGSSEEEGSEVDDEEEEEKSTPGRKRKKIRRLMADAKLQSSTKEAQRAERERIERLKRRQALGKEKEDELILEEDPATKKV